jgi:hypothetical protein
LLFRNDGALHALMRRCAVRLRCSANVLIWRCEQALLSSLRCLGRRRAA